MSTLTSIAVQRYRCFANEFRLSLAPITLLYGWNNAGKSAALRLVGLLNDSIQPDAKVPFVLTGSAGLGGSFRDLEWRGSADDVEPGFWLELAWEHAKVEAARYLIDFSRDREEPYVRRLIVRLSGGKEHRFEVRAPVDHRLFTLDGGSNVELTFNGLLPTLRSGDGGASAGPALAELHAQLVALRGGLQWLSVNRGALPREVPREALAPDIVSFDGSGTAEMLVRDRDLRARVATWYESPHVRRRLNVRESGKYRELTLSVSDGPAANFEIPLAETGAGMSRVLPVLTAAALASRAAAEGKTALLAVEEPESQLHGNALRALVDWLCEIGQSSAPPSLLLETHSRALLVAFQLAVAKGALRADRFRVYWLSQRDDGATTSQVAELDARGIYRADAPLPPWAFADELELSSLYVNEIIT